MTLRSGNKRNKTVIGNALLSVSDKQGIVELAHSLTEAGCTLFSTGGTGQALKAAGVAYTELVEYTGFPEMMNGRVKSLHPRVHGGILSRREIDAEEVQRHKITEFDLVIANLYPFAETIGQIGCTWETAIENIDVGGPTMIRAAAKNNDHVLVITDPADYDKALERIKNDEVDENFRRDMAAKAFRYTAQYDAAIANYFGGSEIFPHSLALVYKRKTRLRYGENPHQRAALYSRDDDARTNIASAKQIQGKQLSFNNVADADAALECALAFDEPACVIVKHGNPCGVAIDSNATAAYVRAHATDPTSSYGGIIAFNVPLHSETLREVIGKQFVEVIIAPKIGEDAIELARNRKNLRLLEATKLPSNNDDLQLKQVSGGMLVQERDNTDFIPEEIDCATRRQPTKEERQDLLFAWRVARYVKSNAIVLAKDLRTVGIGAGQMSRVISARIASMRAEEEGLDDQGCVMASDAFFPFRDAIDSAAKKGVTAAIQPGGSIRDEEVIEAANEYGMAMLLTHVRHFRH